MSGAPARTACTSAARAIEQVLAVVEHQQQPAHRQRLDEHVERRGRAAQGDPERLRDRIRQQAQGRQGQPAPPSMRRRAERPAWACVTAWARRLLPMPPAPTMVMRRCWSRSGSSAWRSASRPYSGGSSRGRLVSGCRRGSSRRDRVGRRRSRLAVGARRAGERMGEAVAAARNGGDGMRAEQLAQGADLDLEVLLLDHHPGQTRSSNSDLATTRSRRCASATSRSNARAPSATGSPC